MASESGNKSAAVMGVVLKTRQEFWPEMPVTAKA